MTLWAVHNPLLHDLGWRGAWSRTIMPRVPLCASFLLLLFRFFLIRFDEGWRRRFQLLQFLDTCLGYPQLLRDFIEPL